MIYFFLKDAPKADEETKIEILDASGKVIRKYSSTEVDPLDEPLDPDDKKPEKQIKAEAGLNRFVWDLRYEEARHVPGYYLWEYGSGARGPVAVPGQYQVRLTADGQTLTAPFELKLDPRVKVSQADLEAQFNLLLATRDELNRVYDTVNQIQDVRAQLAGLKKRLPENASAKTIVGAADDLEKEAGRGARRSGRTWISAPTKTRWRILRSWTRSWRIWRWTRAARLCADRGRAAAV